MSTTILCFCEENKKYQKFFFVFFLIEQKAPYVAVKSY